MDKVKSLFYRPRREDTEKNSHLFNWKRPSFQKDDVSQLNRLLKKLGKSGHATLHMKNKEIEPDHHVLSEAFESNIKLCVSDGSTFSSVVVEHVETTTE